MCLHIDIYTEIRENYLEGDMIVVAQLFSE